MVLGPTPSETITAVLVAERITALTSWAVDTMMGPPPDDVILRRAALILIDDLAAMLAARDEPQVRQAHDRLIVNSGPKEATIFRGGKIRIDRYNAAMANGLAGDWCELDEGYRKATCHAGLYVLPALLAEAEATDQSFARVLQALVVGYEVTARFARAFQFDGLVLHPHGGFNAVGAVAGVAALRGFDTETYLGALGAAATMVSPGPYRHAVEGALVRNVWSGIGASNGLHAADWAEFGIAGHAGSVWDVYGGIMGADAHPDELTVDLGADWAVSDGYHKIHACCQYAHSAVEATLELLQNAGGSIDVADLEAIDVATHWRGRSLDTVEPSTSLAAKFSMPHILAATTLVGHAGHEAFADDVLTDPTLDGLRRRVRLHAYEPEPAWPNDRPARVTWRFTNGRTATAECLSAKGGPDRPFTPSDILNKLEGIVGDVYPGLAEMAPKMTELTPDLLAMSWRDVVARFTDDGGDA